MKRYIYIDESGIVGIGSTPPTDQDLASIEDGILQVIEIEPYLHSNSGGDHPACNVRDVNHDGTQVPLQAAVLADHESGQYHYIPRKRRPLG